MPAPPTELKQTETLSPIVNGDRDEYVERHAEAAGAVSRDNSRINGWRSLYECVREALSAGKVADYCAKPAAK